MSKARNLCYWALQGASFGLAPAVLLAFLDSPKTVVEEKHSSLTCTTVSDTESSVLTLTLILGQCYQLFTIEIGLEQAPFVFFN